MSITAPAPPLPALHAVPVHKGNDAVLVLAGNLDAATVAQARQAAGGCLAARPRQLLLDLHPLRSCDQAGIRELRRILRDAATAGAQTRITGISPALRQALTPDGRQDLLSARPGRVPGKPGHARA